MQDFMLKSKTTSEHNDIQTFVTTHVRLRDGIELTVDYFYISNTSHYPTILELTPYGRGPESVNYRYEAPYWAKLGYVFVIADCRGTGDSQGEMAFFSNDGKDGYDLIEWIASQPWSNGRVGMRGSSYTGTNQWYIAREQPPHLSCITPSASLGRPMEDVPYFSGAFALNWAINWINSNLKIPKLPAVNPHPEPSDWLTHHPLQTMDTYAVGRILPMYRMFLDHPTYDDYWRTIDFNMTDFRRITIPSLSFTGWFDGTMYGTIWRFQGARQYATRSVDQFLVIGPYTHGNAPDGGYDFHTGLPMTTVGDLLVPENALLPGLNMTREFFDWCLKDGSRLAWQPSKIFITGSNRWMTSDRFPPKEAHEISLFLSNDDYGNGTESNQRLQWILPTTASNISYFYDPSDPVRADKIEKPIGLPIDMNPYINRDDILLYTSEILTKSVTVIGNVIIELAISSTAKDTDFVIELMDVWPDGRAIKLGSKAAAQMRARYRDGFDREVLMKPNLTYVVQIQLHEIGHTFLIGHRIKLAVTSSFFPWISANPNTGEPIATDIEQFIVAKQIIYHGGTHPSRVRLMVVDDPIFDT